MSDIEPDDSDILEEPDDIDLMVEPHWKNPVNYRIRDAIAYCEKKGISTADMTDEEVRMFEYPNPDYDPDRKR